MNYVSAKNAAPSDEGGLGRYIATCIDTNKEVGREKYPRLEYFPSPGRIIISASGPWRLSGSSAGLLI